MKEKTKKIGIYILFGLFIFSAICLIASCTMKTKKPTGKLAVASQPKLAFKYNGDNNTAVSTNLAPLNNFNCRDLENWNISASYYRLFGIGFNPSQSNGVKVGMTLKYSAISTNRSYKIIFKEHINGNINTAPSCNLPVTTANYTISKSFRDIIDLSGARDTYYDIYIALMDGGSYTNLNNGLTINELNIFLYDEPTIEHPYIQNSFENNSIYSPFGTFVNGAELSQQVIDQYNYGYYTGYEKGQENKDNEVAAARDSGYQIGKRDGLALAENGDFNDMITAVADTPLKILYDFFNFEILGVNLWVFFTSVLSILIVIFIIKKIK